MRVQGHLYSCDFGPRHTSTCNYSNCESPLFSIGIPPREFCRLLFSHYLALTNIIGHFTASCCHSKSTGRVSSYFSKRKMKFSAIWSTFKFHIWEATLYVQHSRIVYEEELFRRFVFWKQIKTVKISSYWSIIVCCLTRIVQNLWEILQSNMHSCWSISNPFGLYFSKMFLQIPQKRSNHDMYIRNIAQVQAQNIL